MLHIGKSNYIGGTREHHLTVAWAVDACRALGANGIVCSGVSGMLVASIVAHLGRLSLIVVRPREDRRGRGLVGYARVGRIRARCHATASDP